MNTVSLRITDYKGTTVEPRTLVLLQYFIALYSEIGHSMSRRWNSDCVKRTLYSPREFYTVGRSRPSEGLVRVHERWIQLLQQDVGIWWRYFFQI